MVHIVGEIDRVENPTVERFVADYLEPQKPVVLTGALRDWPALERWDPGYLREVVGTRQLRVEAVTATGPPGIFGRQTMPELTSFRDYVDRVFSDQSVPRLYMGGISLNASLRELAGDVCLPAYVQGDRKPVPYFWLGAGRTTTRLHYDINNNFHALVRGLKTFILFPPDQSRCLYPTSVFVWRRHFSRVNLDQPDDTRFPRLKEARGCQATLRRGDMLFLPSLWWHEVRTIEPSIGVNYWWGSNSYGDPLAWLYVRELPLLWWTRGRAQLRWRTRQLLGRRS